MFPAVINNQDPYVFIDQIQPDIRSNRIVAEHRAGIDLLGYGLSYIGLSLKDYRVDYNDFGKPFLRTVDCSVRKTPPYFNLAHCSEWVACAISIKEVGCDIEKIKPISQYLNREIDKVRNLKFTRLCKDDHVLDTVQHWTIYESVGKCYGIGIPIDEEVFSRKSWIIKSWVIEKKYILSISQ